MFKRSKHFSLIKLNDIDGWLTYRSFHGWEDIPKPQRLIPCSSYYCLQKHVQFQLSPINSPS